MPGRGGEREGICDSQLCLSGHGVAKQKDRLALTAVSMLCFEAHSAPSLLPPVKEGL